MIWILNHYASPPDRGVGTRHFDLSQVLVRRGYAVTIFAAGFSHFTGREERLAGRRALRAETIGGMRWVWLRTLAYRGNGWRRIVNMVSYAALVLVAQARFARPDIVIGSTVHPFAALAGLLIARLRRAPFVFEIRDLWPQTLIDMGRLSPSSATARALYWMEALLVHQAVAVVTLLPGVTEYLRERGLPTDTVRYLPNGIWIERDAGTVPSAVREAVDAAHGSGRLVAAYAGVHGEINGLSILIRAAQLCAQRNIPVQVLFIGDGPEKPALQALARRLRLDNVTFLEPVAKDDVGAVLRTVDVAIFHLADTPVLRFGISSNKLFDYLFAERPVIFACRSSNDPVAEAQAGISIAPNDPPAMAAALSDMARMDPAERAAMGARGAAHARRWHDIEVIGARLADLVDEHAR